MTYIIVDTANTFFRARHVINGDADIKLGMALHITFNSIKKAWQDFGGSHVVFCLEGRSWRKDFYAPISGRAASRVSPSKSVVTLAIGVPALSRHQLSPVALVRCRFVAEVKDGLKF